MPAKRRGKAVLVPSAPAYSFGSTNRPFTASALSPGPGAYNVHFGLERVQAASGATAAGSKRPETASGAVGRKQRFEVLQDAARMAQAGLRSAPSFSIAGRPVTSTLQAITPGPGSFEANSKASAKCAPAYTFRGASVPEHSGLYPGPGLYKPQRGISATRPCNPPPLIKPRIKVPTDDSRKPAPGAYSPSDPLAMYKGEYTAVKMKFRPQSFNLRPAISPGPSEYDLEKHPHRKPAYSMGLKTAQQANSDNPGPGTYDVHDSTIGNWGAGMAAALPPELDTSLEERVAAFARTASQPHANLAGMFPEKCAQVVRSSLPARPAVKWGFY